MAYSTEEARVQLLDDIAHAIDELGVALAALGAAYELLDERAADQLEAELFRPVQVAYGRAQRTHAGFAERFKLAGRKFEPSTAGRVSQGAKKSSTPRPRRSARPSTCWRRSRDSMMPVEVGDATSCRCGLARSASSSARCRREPTSSSASSAAELLRVAGHRAVVARQMARQGADREPGRLALPPGVGERQREGGDDRVVELV